MIADRREIKTVMLNGSNKTLSDVVRLNGCSIIDK